MLAYKMGDASALEELFVRYKRPILNYALRILRNLADAEEVVSETFYNLVNKHDNYRVQAKFSTWLYTIAHNIACDKIRKKARVVFLWFRKDAQSEELEQIDLPDTKDTPDLRAEQAEAAELVKQAVQSLPPAYREAVILREYQGLDYQEISKVMGCSLAKVKVLIFRARERLRRQLQPIMGETYVC